MKEPKKKRVYLALVFQTSVISRYNDPPVDGPQISLTNKDLGLIGMLPVFKTMSAARKVWGRNVKLHPIDLPETPK